MTPEQRQSLDRRTWQLFTSLLESEYPLLRAQLTRYVTTAKADPGWDTDHVLAVAYARIQEEAPALLLACEAVHLRARATAILLESGIWPGSEESSL